MPLYEYRCEACGKEIEVLQKISDPPRTECPACGQSALVKKLTAAGFQLKGTGWYVTDFRGGTSTTPSPKTESQPSAEAAPETTAAPAATPDASKPAEPTSSPVAS